MASADLSSKQGIMATLRLMDPVAADAAKYFADMLIENRKTLGDQRALNAMAGAAMVRAHEDANLPGGPSVADAVLLAREHGEEIGRVAVAMATFVCSKETKLGWIAVGVGAAVGLAIAALTS